MEEHVSANAKRVLKYRLAYNPKDGLNHGTIEVLVEGGTAPLVVPIDSPAEYVIVAALLGKSELFLLADGTLVTKVMRAGG